MHVLKLFLGLFAVSAVAIGLATNNAHATTPTVRSVGTANSAVAQAPPQVSNGSTIYSNLGPGGNYYPYYGSCVSGSASSCGRYQAIAMPFTGNGTYASQIDLGLTNYTGTNDATIQLARDNGSGLPGAVLATWSVTNQPPWGSCCGLTSIQLSQLIPVAAGKQYWVIAYPGSKTSNTADVWNENYYDYTGPFAVDQGAGWVHANGPLSAFDVLGCGKVCKV